MVYLDGMFVKHQSSWLWSIGENADYSYNMVYLDVMFVEHQSSWLWSISESAHYS